MKVNRVFCYSSGVAQKNGNVSPIKKLTWMTILGVFIIMGLIIVTKSSVVATLSVAVWLGIIVYYSVILGLRIRTKMTGFAIDTEGRVYRARLVKSEQGLLISGIVHGKIFDRIVGTDGLGKSVGAIAGANATIKAMENNSLIMTQPEIIAKIVEAVPNVEGAEVLEILKVYSIIDKGNSLKVKCDYREMISNKTKYSQVLTLEKSYNMFEELVNILSKLK